MKFNHLLCTLHRVTLMIFIVYISRIPTQAQSTSSETEKETQLIEALKEELTGNIQKSIDILEKLKYESEFKAVSYYLLSRMYFKQDKKEEALNAINQSVLNEPDNKWYLLLKSNIAENLSLPEEAAACNEALLRLEPNTYTYYDHAAYLYLQAGLNNKAFAVLDKAEVVFGLTPEIAIKKAFILGDIKKFKKAIEVLESCLLKHPGHQEIIGHLFTLSQKSNDKKLVAYIQSKYTPVQDLIPPSKSVESDLLDAVFSNPDADIDTKIKSLLNHLQHIDQKDAEKINALQKYGDQLLREYPTNSKSHCVVADLYFLQSNYILAKEQYMKAIEVGNVPYVVWDNLFITLTELAHWNTSVQMATRCLDFYPNQTNPYYILALGYFKLKDFDKAQAQMATLDLMVKHKKNIPARFLVLKAKIADALQSDSQKLWEQALLMDTLQTVLLEKYINACMAQPQNFTIPETKTMLSHNSFQTDRLLAELYHCMQNYTMAKKHLESAMTYKSFMNSEFHTLASEIYRHLGMIDLSQQHKQKAETLGEPLKKQ